MAEVAQDAITVEVPDIGDFSDVGVVEVHVAEGDMVAENDPLVTLETDKATMDVPSTAAGKVVEVLVEVGGTASKGTAVVKIEPEGGADEKSGDDSEDEQAGDSADDGRAEDDRPKEDGAEDDYPGGDDEPPASRTDAAGGAIAAESSARRDGSGDHPPINPTVPERRADGVYASPSARRHAREHDLDLGRVSGSGRQGRITLEDVERAAGGGGAGSGDGDAALGLLPWPKVDHQQFGEVEHEPLSRIRKISRDNLARNWVMIPHVTHHDEADVTELEAFRRQLNDEQDEVKVTMVALLLKALVASLKAFPNVNSSLEGDELVLKSYYHLGFAADTPGGLVVPVVRDVDKKGLLELAGEITELSGKARGGKLGPGDMQGGTFTLSSLGGIGGTGFTPIVNAPQVAILGVVRSAMKPVWDGEQFVPRLMLPLSLSYDHRVVDGAEAARFTAHLASVLSDLRRVML